MNQLKEYNPNRELIHKCCGVGIISIISEAKLGNIIHFINIPTVDE